MFNPQESMLDITNTTPTALKNVIWRPFSPSPSHSPSEVSLPLHNVCPLVQFGHSAHSLFLPVEKKAFTCSKCLSRFRSSFQMKSHMKTHSGTKPYICDYPSCSKDFSRKEELNRHKRIHSGYKPYICGICNKCFGRKDHLSKHLKTHLQASEKKIYVCCVPGCGHRYTRSDALTRHKTTAHAIPKSRTFPFCKKYEQILGLYPQN